MAKEIEQITDEDLGIIWGAIGGTPHLFEHGKEELRQVLTTGECGIEYESEGEIKESPIGLQLDYYTMSAIVKILIQRGFQTPDFTQDGQLIQQ